jgi:hypothetical protein
VTDDLTPAPGGSSGAWSRRMEYLIPLGLLVLWIVLQIWVLPKAGVKT